MATEAMKDKILKLLDQKKVNYKIVRHAAAPTCELSAEARGEPLKNGGKTLLFKGKKSFFIAVISAEKTVDSNRLRKIIKSQRLRFATDEEFQELTGVPKGALPPLSSLFEFDFFVDTSILNLERVAFNAGELTTSIILSTEDYLELIRAKYCHFSKNSE
ncbi:MAG: aminoacyl-tRNA deacylase [Bacteriovoracaceae bacterium]